MTHEEKAELRAQIMVFEPCEEAINKFDKAEVGDPTTLVMLEYGSWCNHYSIAIPRLSEGLTTIGGYCYLIGYAHPLPSGLTTIGGYCYLVRYGHPLPSGLTTIGGDCYLEGYAHPLPSGLTSIGGYCYLRGYAHPLPSGLKIKGTIYN